MNKLIALCLSLCVIVLSACSNDQEIKVIKNEVPASLLRCEDRPAAPNVRTGDNTQDFKNAVRYKEELEYAFDDCKNKNIKIGLLVNGTQSNNK